MKKTAYPGRRTLLGISCFGLLQSVSAVPIEVQNSDFSADGAVNNQSVPGWIRYNSDSNGYGVNGGSDGAPDAPSAFAGNENGLQQTTAHVIAAGDVYTLRVTASLTSTNATADLVVDFFADDGVPTLLGSRTIELGEVVRDWRNFSAAFTFSATDPNASLAGNNLIVGLRTSSEGFVGFDTVLLDEGPLGILYWDGTDTDANANGGAGTWDLVTTNWDTASAGGSDSTWSDGLDAVFGGAAGGAVTLGVPISAGSLVFNTAGYDVSGNILTLGGTTPLIATFADATISSSLAGSEPLTKTESSTLTLSGDNAGYLGGLTVADGVVDLQSSFGSSVTVASSLAGEGTITGDLILNEDSTLNVDPSTTTALAVSGDVTLAGPIGLSFSETPVGDVTLLTYTGSVVGDLADFVFDGRGQIVNTGSALVLQAVAASDLVWNGASSRFWSLGDTSLGDQNWDNAGVSDFFFAGDSVTFTDTAAGMVTLDNSQGALAPSSVTFNNSVGNDYVLSAVASDGNIVGPASLTKEGAGTTILQTPNTYTGGTFVNEGVLELAQGAGAIPTLVGEVTVTGPGILNLAVNNVLGFQAARRVDILNVFDGGLVDNLAMADNGFALEINLRGGTMQNTGGGQFAFANGTEVNSLASETTSVLDGRATVRSSFPFNVADGAADTDLLVSADLVQPNQDGGPFAVTKNGEGVLRFAGSNYDYNGGTVVSQGCLIVDGLASIPADLAQVTVAADAGFGAIAGPSNATGDDFAAIAANVGWDASGTSFLVVDTNGEDVVISADFVGNYILLKKGAGILTLSGTVTVATQEEEGSINIDPNAVEPPRAFDGILITDCGTTPGTNSGLMFSISFASSGSVDVYASSDLVDFGTAPIAANVTTSPFIEDDVAEERRFYILVPAGATFP